MRQSALDTWGKGCNAQWYFGSLCELDRMDKGLGDVVVLILKLVLALVISQNIKQKITCSIVDNKKPNFIPYEGKVFRLLCI